MHKTQEVPNYEIRYGPPDSGGLIARHPRCSELVFILVLTYLGIHCLSDALLVSIWEVSRWLPM